MRTPPVVRISIALLLGLTLMSGADPASAEQTPPETASQEANPAEETSPSAASQETTVTGGTLMLVAYICLWVLIFGYLYYLHLGQKRLDEEQRQLSDELERLSDNFMESDVQ